MAISGGIIISSYDSISLAAYREKFRTTNVSSDEFIILVKTSSDIYVWYGIPSHHGYFIHDFRTFTPRKKQNKKVYNSHKILGINFLLYKALSNNEK